jgi:hypothetical protein
MLKSSAFLIGFFFFVSTLYYVSYWGAFGIDAFQFLEVQDITKGILFPVKYSLITCVCYLILMGFLFSLEININSLKKTLEIKNASDELSIIRLVMRNDKRGIRKMRLSSRISSFIIPLLLLIYYFYSDTVSQLQTSIISFIASICVSNVLSLLMPAIHRLIFTGPTNKHFLYHSSLTMIIFISGYSYLSGITESRAVLLHKRFRYTAAKYMTDTQGTKSKVYILVGKIGNKYSFIDFSNQEKIFIDQTVMPKLVLRVYDTDKKETVTLLNTVLKAPLPSATLISPASSPSLK